MNRFLLYVLLLGTLPAHSQAAPPAVQKPAGGGYLPYAKIVQCLRAQQRVSDANRELQAEKTTLDQNGVALLMQNHQLNQSGEQLAARIRQQNLAANRAPPTPRTDSSNPQLDRYLHQYSGTNGERRKHNKALSVHNQRQTAHNAEVERYNQSLARFNQQLQLVDRNCGGAKVRPAELAAARAQVAAEDAAATPAIPAAPLN